MSPVNLPDASEAVKRRTELLADVDGDADYADAETQGRLAFLAGDDFNPHADDGAPRWAWSEAAREWQSGYELEWDRAERIAKTVSHERNAA